MSYLKWSSLVLGYQKHQPLNIATSGSVSLPGIYPILGQNGCGKSTLLKTWLGLVPPLQGHVEKNEKNINPEESFAEGVSYVPQTHNVNKYFPISVEDFVAQGFGPKLFLHLAKNHREKMQQLLMDWELEGHEKKVFHELSAGQKTRALIVRAFLSKPKILFLDEPLANLDSCCRQLLMEKLFVLTKEQKMCVFLVDHHLEKYAYMFQSQICFEKRHDEQKARIVLEKTQS